MTDQTKFDYPARDGGQPHIVTVTPREGIRQVGVRCSCPAFKFTQYHECWHALDVVKKNGLVAVVGGVLYNHPDYPNKEAA